MRKNINFLFFIGIAIILTACGGKTDQPESTLQAVTEIPTETVLENNNGAFQAKPADGVIDLSNFGMKITLPEAVQDIPISANGYLQDDFGVVNLCMADESDPNNQDCIFGEIFAYPDMQSPDALVDESSGMTGDMVVDLGTNEALYYYVFRLDELRKTSPEQFEQIMAGLDDEQKSKYEKLLDSLPDMINGMELTNIDRPEISYSAEEMDTSEIMDYMVSDLDGKEVRLGDLIFKNRLTMLNVWGISCGPCLMEMTALEKLSRQFRGQGFEVIGLAADLVEPSGKIDPMLMSDAKEFGADLGVTYPLLAMDKTIRDKLKITATPTTVFVDSNGQVIGEVILGSRDERVWERMILSALNSLNY